MFGLLGACASQPTPSTLTQTPASVFVAPADTPTVTALPATLIPTATATARPTSQPTQTALPTFTPTPCVDKARFINETVPDNTVVEAGASFEKVWVLENNGTCPWTAYQLRMNDGGGLKLADAGPIMLQSTVLPGAQTNITLTLRAPLLAGTYRSDFMLVGPQRQPFGVGVAGQTPIYAQVVVETSAATATPAPTQINCSYHATYVNETIPDNSKMFPGELFSKQWTVKNTGTCTWVGVRLPWQGDGGGLGMPPGAPRVGNPQGEVPPGGSITLGWPIIAPQAPGTYRADFKLGVANAPDFGLGKNADTPLYVQIVVVDVPAPANASELNLGAPAWHDTFDRNEFRWAVQEASNENVAFSISNGGLVMDVQHGEYWTVGSMPASRGQVHETVFQTGAKCAGQNAYGLLVGLNADPHSGAYTDGYLFRLTCDGQYSVGYIHSMTYLEQLPIELAGLTPTAALRSGPNQTNRVLVITAGGKTILYLNGSKVLEFKDLTTTQYENGAVTREFPFDLSMLTYPFLYDTPGRPGLYISSEAGQFVVTVDEYNFWDLEGWVK